MGAFKELMQNPLWWVLPAILIASWMVNHRTPTSGDGKKEPPAKKNSESSSSESSSPPPPPAPADDTSSE